MELNCVDYKERKENKEKVIPYDKVKPYVKIEEKNGFIDGTFNFYKLDQYIKSENIEDINIVNSSIDYKILWLLFLLENNIIDTTEQKKEDMLKEEKTTKNRLILDAYIKTNTMCENTFLYQTNVVSLLPFFSLNQIIVLSTLNVYNSDIKKGFLDLTSGVLKKRKTKMNTLLFFKYIFEKEIDISLFDIMKKHTENKTNLLIEKENVFFEGLDIGLQTVFIKGKEVAFNIKDLKAEDGIPIHILYQTLKSKFGIFSFEMIRILSFLEKNNILIFKKGIIKPNKSISTFFTLQLHEDILDFIQNNERKTANKIIAQLLKKKEIKCTHCSKGKLMFSQGAYCSNCGIKFKKKYYNMTLSQQQISILNYTGQILFFKGSKPMILRKKLVLNKYFYSVEN